MTNRHTPVLNILLADDDKDDRFFFELAIKEIARSSKFKAVIDGEQLLDYLSKSLENLPDVIFLDINMPRKNGKESLILLKNDQALKHIPVIIYSTSMTDYTADLFYQLGAHYYLQKCNYSDLIMLLQNIFAILEINPDKPAREDFVFTPVKSSHKP